MLTGGNAYLDVVFDNGTVSRRIPEAIIHSVQWTVHDEVYGANQIADALARAEEAKAQAEAAEAARKAAFQAEVDRLKAAPEYAHLQQCDNEHDGRIAAANIRTTLKRQFPKVKFSVRKRHYGSIGVTWTDGPTDAQVEEAVAPFKGGRFDSSQDLASFETTPWIHVFGGVQYLSTTRETSPALIGRMIDTVFADYAGNLAGIQKPTPADYFAGRLWTVQVPLLNTDLQTLVRQAASELPA